MAHTMAAPKSCGRRERVAGVHCRLVKFLGAKFDLAGGLEAGDRTVAADGVELVGPRIRFSEGHDWAGGKMPAPHVPRYSTSVFRWQL